MLLLRPIFTGTDSYSQIQLLIEYLGTPDEQVIRRIKSPSIRDYISSFGPKTPLPFTAMFPNASIEARNIVSKVSFILEISYISENLDATNITLETIFGRTTSGGTLCKALAHRQK